MRTRRRRYGGLRHLAQRKIRVGRKKLNGRENYVIRLTRHQRFRYNPIKQNKLDYFFFQIK